MSERNVRGLSALAVAVFWSVATLSSAGASMMPTDHPAESAAPAPPPDSPDEALPVTATDAFDGAADGEDGPAADEIPAAAEPGELHFPIDGIRPHTEVVGAVVGHPTGKLLLSTHDVVTLKFKGSRSVQPRDHYAIARREQFVEHPDSGRNMGYVVRVVATVEMREAFERYWSAEIVSSTDYVTLDDWVIPFEPATEQTANPPSDAVGSIVAVRDDLVLAGEANVVYTDLGTAQGVNSGDEFTIIRPGTGGRRGSPDRPVGLLRILEVETDSSSAYLTDTTEPIMIGDRLEPALVSSAVQ